MKVPITFFSSGLVISCLNNTTLGSLPLLTPDLLTDANVFIIAMIEQEDDLKFQALIALEDFCPAPLHIWLKPQIAYRQKNQRHQYFPKTKPTKIPRNKNNHLRRR